MISRFLYCVVLLGLFTASGICVPKDTAVPIKSTSYSKVVTAANELVSKAGLKWGSPVRVLWQDAPLNRYLVVYSTPQAELGYAGDRTVFVSVDFRAWFGFRG